MAHHQHAEGVLSAGVLLEELTAHDYTTVVVARAQAGVGQFGQDVQVLVLESFAPEDHPILEAFGEEVAPIELGGALIEGQRGASLAARLELVPEGGATLELFHVD